MGLIDYSDPINNLKEETQKAKREFFSFFAMEGDSVIKNLKKTGDGQTEKNIFSEAESKWCGDKKLSLIKLLLAKVLPRTSDDQKAYLYIMEIICAKRIYGDEFEQDVVGMMLRNDWTTMNDKAIMYGPRRGGKSTASSAFVASIGFVLSMEINIYGNVQDTSKEFGNYIKTHLEKIDREYPGLLRIEKDNGKRLIFSRGGSHKTIIRFLPGSVDISIFLFFIISSNDHLQIQKNIIAVLLKISFFLHLSLSLSLLLSLPFLLSLSLITSIKYIPQLSQGR